MELVLQINEDPLINFLMNRDLGLWQVLNIILLGLGRIIPIIAMTPFLGAKSISDPMKIGFSLAILGIYFPFLLFTSTVSVNWDMHFIALMLKEVLIGLIIGMILSMPYYYALGAGGIIDHQRGAQSLQVTDPSTQTQSSPIGQLYGNVMLISFFFIGGPLLFFDALFSSFQVIPLDRFLPPSFFSQTNPMWQTLIELIHQLFRITIQLAAPSLIAILMSDLFLGIANRMAPQVQISFLLWSLKAFIGVAILWLAWWLVLKQMDVINLESIRNLSRLIDRLPTYT